MLSKINQLTKQLENATQSELKEFMDEYEQFRNEIIYKQSKKEIRFSLNLDFIRVNEFKLFSNDVKEENTLLFNNTDKEKMKEVFLEKTKLGSRNSSEVFPLAS